MASSFTSSGQIYSQKVINDLSSQATQTVNCPMAFNKRYEITGGAAPSALVCETIPAGRTLLIDRIIFQTSDAATTYDQSMYDASTTADMTASTLLLAVSHPMITTPAADYTFTNPLVVRKGLAFSALGGNGVVRWLIMGRLI